MMRIINVLLALVAYLSVATVISLSIGIGYLWHTDHLNDDKMFRIMALLQDIDLQKIAEAQHDSKDDVPPEEPSLESVLRRQHVQDRNLELKMLAFQRARQDYDHRLQDLKSQTDRFDRLAREWQTKFQQQQQAAMQENMAKVVSQLEQVEPDTAKKLLMRWLNEGRMDDAIVLMSKMSEKKLSNILKTFETDLELDKLHEIHQRIIAGGAPMLEKALGELQAAGS